MIGIYFVGTEKEDDLAIRMRIMQLSFSEEHCKFDERL